jgi:hypothetical protein
MIKIKDKGDYFLVTLDGLESITYAKSESGFRTKEELENYLDNRRKIYAEWGN